ncbi:uncharacterized protein LOC132612809 [Lycium barbarum]|uniref:uncharacterized protein LOC132612809 n=1 Tax=Lycium barbarum TaxID=112863 RepID=UPI00293F778B|nr:uncharacterized protein LOC132612809 [Lycium barbarum]
MEYLSRFLKKMGNLLDFRFHPMCKNQQRTHLTFKDDLMIFSKATETSIKKVMEVLQHFSSTTGLVANNDKSNIFIVGVGDDMKEKLLRMTGFTSGTFPIRYLGLPLSPKKWNKLECHQLCLKITERIRGAANKHLSYAGRLQEVDKLCRGLLWGNTEETNKKHLVAWEKICRPKGQGGPNIKGWKYSVGNGYQDLLGARANEETAKIIWTSIAMPKHRFILWLAAQERLLTKVRVHGMGLKCDTIECELCVENEVEDAAHLFHNCTWTKTVWSKVQH